MKKRIKTLTSIILTATLTTAVLASCSSEPATTEPDVTSNSGVEEEIILWHYWESPAQQGALGTAIDKFNQEQTEYKAVAKYVPFADFKKQLSIGASTSELPDIAIIDNPDNAAYASMGIFADLTDEFDLSTYYDGPVESAMLDGRLYGVPMGSNNLLLYYNEDMLKAAGKEVPTTWDELLDVAKATTTDRVSGFAHSSVQNEEGTFNFLTWMWSTDVSSYEINSEGGIASLSMMKELVDSGAMTKEAINWTQGDCMNQFISGNLAMMINGTWQVPTMRSEAPDLNWKVAPIPIDKENTSGLGGENYAVISGGNEAGAIEFIKFSQREDICLEMMSTMGNISSNSVVAAKQYEGDEVYQEFIKAMEYTKARGPHPEWPSISDAISLAFNEVITGSSTPEDAAKKAQDTIDSIIN